MPFSSYPHNFLQLISDHLPDMLWVKDIKGHYLFANQSICKNLLMANNTDEPLGKTDVYFALREREKHPENPQWHTFGELCFNSDEIVLTNMRSMRFEEYGNIRGELVYLDVHKAPLFGADGTLIGVIGSGRDITVQKRLELEKEMTQRLIESGPVVVFEWSADEGWPIRYVSSNVEMILGISHEQLMSGSTSFSNFIHPDDIVRIVTEVNEFFSDKTSMFIQEYRIIREDGTFLWIKDFTVVEYHKESNVPMSIKGYIIDNTVEKIANERASYFTHFDHLTGLPNRQKMLEDMEETPPVGCAIFNIDSFREINDFFGIVNADKLLIQLANESKKMWTPTYRIGGDEFAILFYKTISASALKEVIDNILNDMDRLVFTVGGEKIKVHFRVGIAFGVEKLLTRADIALHIAKEKKLPYALYEVADNIEDKYQKNIQMASAVHKALSDGRIICYYQPIVHIEDNKVYKYETLVRMVDEEGNIVPPMEFLPIAKKMQLYPQITQTVVHQACNIFAKRTEEFSVNLSIDDIDNPYTVQNIVNTIINTETANRIVFEILESDGIENYESVIRFATQVRALGAKIAIDDFGTGYSNFEHILRLNVDYIKIDGSLIRGIVNNKRHRIIVETIVQFAEKMGASTIAEFVCDEEIFDTIKHMGIEFSQGYYTGKPLPLT
ncbi:MAG: EAL domain-containing protein [Sulfuricurvum sp.]|uniref:EAL domain-containing protein n=1 Tax=Sulfuricurvum sp. TaxID=2025608 RepID=UPI002609809E|nr:EAL domain-containing protein [Sulfuricurvum sp.]MDD2829153.1 EAL domain-containing protein [Sulfuricurvum sp.]MDD4950202.1 EAL domain-containing protein [Sulfuricurvum sp.]